MRVARACVPLGLLLLFLSGAQATWLELHATGAGPLEQAAQRTPIVYTAEVDGIIHPIATAYIRRAIAQADAAQADLLVIVLRTPGGLVDSTRDINTAIIQSKTPVVVFVSPAGSRAASAGFLITIAADVAAMAPGTHIGAAHPVSGDGQKVDDTMSKKMTSDVAGYARTIAAQRKRNVALVEQAVTESRTFTEQEAATADPPLIDVIATDLPDLLKKLDGRTIHRFDGASQTLHTIGAEQRAIAMTWAQKVLSAVAHPQIAYLLLMLGTLGLTVELWNPGLDPARRRRGHLPAAGLLCLPGAAGQLCRRPPDPLWARPAHPRGQGHELRPPRGGRGPQPVLRVDSADGFAVT